MKKIHLPSLLIVILLIAFLGVFNSCQKSVDNSASDIAALKAAVAALQKTTDSLSKALATTNSNITSVSNKVDSILAQIVLIQQQINVLDSQLTITNANITAINAQIALLNQQYAKLLAELNDILAQLAITPSSLLSGLVAYFPFTGNANDSSGNGNNGTVYGASFSTDRFGNVNSSYFFNGTNNYISLTNTFFKGQIESKLSLSVWFKISSYPASNSLYTIWDKQGFWREESIQISSNGSIGYWWTYPNPQAYYGAYSQAAIIPLNQWNNFIFIMNGTTSNIYLNGQLLSTSSNTSNGLMDFSYLAAGNSTSTNIIGAAKPAAGTEYFMNGSIDDFRLYDRALTQQEITYLATH